MEVNPASKGLHKHALPVVMVMLALLSVPVIEFSHAAANDPSPSVGSSLARGLLTPVIRVQPTNDGLAKVTLAQPLAADQNPTAGASLAGPAQAGRAAQLSLSLTGF
jgi:hypothetical protein